MIALFVAIVLFPELRMRLALLIVLSQLIVLDLEHAFLLAEGEVGDPGAGQTGAGNAGSLYTVLFGIDKLVHHVDHIEHFLNFAALIFVEVQQPEAQVDGQPRLANDFEAFFVESEEFGDLPELGLQLELAADYPECGTDDGAEAVLDFVGSEAARVVWELLLKLVLDVAEVLALLVRLYQYLFELIVPYAFEFGLDRQLPEGLQLYPDFLAALDGLQPLLDLGFGCQLDRFVEFGHLQHSLQGDAWQVVGQAHEVEEGFAEGRVKKQSQVL